MAKIKIELDERDLREAVDEWVKRRYGSGVQAGDDISLSCEPDPMQPTGVFAASAYIEKLKD